MQDARQGCCSGRVPKALKRGEWMVFCKNDDCYVLIGKATGSIHKT